MKIYLHDYILNVMITYFFIECNMDYETGFSFSYVEFLKKYRIRI